MTPLTAEQKNRVEENQGLVTTFIRKIRAKHPWLCDKYGNEDDLLQDGFVVLCKCAKQWDPTHESGAAFSTYVCNALYREILPNCMANGLVTIPRDRVSRTHCTEASNRAIMSGAASYLGMFERKGSAGFVEETVVKDGKPHTELALDVSTALAYLPERDRALVIRHFGLDGKPEQTLRQTGEELGINNRQRTHQVLRKSLQRMKQTLGDYDDHS